jgi:hypothetical protein
MARLLSMVPFSKSTGVVVAKPSLSPVHDRVTITGHVSGMGLTRWDVPFTHVDFLVGVGG